MNQKEMIKDFLNDKEKRIYKMDSISILEDDIVSEAINFAYSNPGSKVIVLNNIVKDFLINEIIKENPDSFSKTKLNALIITKENILNTKTMDGLETIITLFLQNEDVEKIFENTEVLYYRIFLPDKKDYYDLSILFEDNKEEEIKVIKQAELNKDDFQEAIRLAMNEKSENLLEIKVKDLNDIPKVFYKGQEVDYEKFIGVAYTFEFSDEEFEGTHKVNLAFENNGHTEAIQHGK